MLTKDILRTLDLGAGVAEHEQMMGSHFLKTDIYYSLIQNKIDIISGAKGTGKSSIYKYVIQNYKKIPELSNTEVIAAINPTGNPVFKVVTEQDNINENQFIALWKWYIFSLAGNSTVESFKDGKSDSIKRLEYMLNLVHLRVVDHKPKNVFQHIVTWFRKLANPASIEGEVSVDPKNGMPSISIKAGYADEVVIETENETITPDQALEFLDKLFKEKGYRIWVLMDRLDEAFQGFSEIGYIALRSLFRAYLDMLGFDQIKIKLFVRDDLFGKVIGKNFVNLTHINARRRKIYWNDDDLIKLLHERICSSQELREYLSIKDPPYSEIFLKLFPPQIEKGQKKAKTWAWIFKHIRDGNDVRAPRNLIDLIKEARDEQIHRDEQDLRVYFDNEPLLQPISIRQGHKRLSRKRVEDTLSDEGGEVAAIIEQFRHSKAEHNGYSLSQVIGRPLEGSRETPGSREIIDFLADIGFLEPIGSSYRIPLLYCEGLNITQGKAF